MPTIFHLKKILRKNSNLKNIKFQFGPIALSLFGLFGLFCSIKVYSFLFLPEKLAFYYYYYRSSVLLLLFFILDLYFMFFPSFYIKIFHFFTGFIYVFKNLQLTSARMSLVINKIKRLTQEINPLVVYFISYNNTFSL